MKAGLLPRLAKHVLAVYVEATAGGDRGPAARRRCARRAPDWPAGWAWSRRWPRCGGGGSLRPGQKVLLVLDQFEQWLHARRGEENTELVAALRQCDGEHVQASSWSGTTSGWRPPGSCGTWRSTWSKAEHRRSSISSTCGTPARCWRRSAGPSGPCPSSQSGLTREQEAFLDQAVAGLAQDGKVISVRLALFAEMVKGKPWTPATLREVGGTEGVGVTFLEETFSSPQANPEHRLHQKAAQAVLKALLPETGTDIKGQMRSEAELRDASGYAGRPRDFDDLLRILDRELRLITPTDPEGSTGEGAARQAGGRAVLPAHPRLPGPLAAGLADPQAAGDPARPGRAAAGGAGRALERQAGEPAPALGAGVGQHPPADSRRTGASRSGG